MLSDFCVLVGGKSTEHDASLLSYQGLLLDIAGRNVDCIKLIVFLDRHGRIVIHRGFAEPVPVEELACGGEELSIGCLLDVLREAGLFIVNLLHGNEGEDGAWQGTAEVAGLFGSFGDVLSSAMGMDKWVQSLCGQHTRRY